MKKTNQASGALNIPGLIRTHRLGLGMSMVVYAGRYGVRRQTVFNWEKGLTEAPYQVIEDALEYGGEAHGR